MIKNDGGLSRRRQIFYAKKWEIVVVETDVLNVVDVTLPAPKNENDK